MPSRDERSNKGFAQLVFKFADGLADRRLSAEKLFCGAGKAPFMGNRQKDFQLSKFHGTS